MDTITIGEIKKFIARKEKMREYSREYRLRRKSYYAQKQREYRARQKAKKEADENVRNSGGVDMTFTDPGQAQIQDTN